MSLDIIRLIERIRKNELLSESTKDMAICYIVYAYKNDKLELNPYNDVSSIFTWRKTPQGHEFWSRISKTLDDSLI